MNAQSKPFVLASLALLLLGGCVSSDPRPAFDDVSKSVSERTGQSVQWQNAQSGHDEAAGTVAQLLKTKLSAQTAEAIALLNNHSLQASFAEIGISQAELAQAARLHNILLFGSWRFPNQPPSALDAEYSASADLLDLLTLPARKKIASRNLEETKLRVADNVLQLAAETKTAFYTLQGQREIIARLTVIAEANDAAADIAQRQFDAGNINDLELRNRQAPAAQSKLDLMRARAVAQSQREHVNRLLGLKGEQCQWQMADELPPLPESEPPPGNLEAMAVNRRLDLAAKRRRMESIAAALRLEKKARFVPGAMVGVDTEAMQNGQRVTGPTLALEAPLFDQGQPALARLVAVYSQARDDFEAAEVNVRSEVREGQAAVAAARESVAFAQDKLLPLRRQVLRDTLLQYNAMQKSSYDLLWAREREQEAERSAVEASRDYWLARVSLERALGGRLPGETNSIATRPPDQPVPAESEHAHHH